jgi:hypothetical protein
MKERKPVVIPPVAVSATESINIDQCSVTGVLQGSEVSGSL